MAVLLVVNLVQGMMLDGWWGLGWMSITMAIMLVTILLHELCHCWAAISLGGSATQILFWPLGGLAYVDFPGGPRESIRVSGAGPLSNFVLCIACLGTLLVMGIPWNWNFLNPFHSWWPPGLTIPQVFILHAARINLILGLLNLCVPAYPLDGGQILMSALTLRYGQVRAAELTAFVAIPIGIVLAVFGFARGDFFLGLIGVWVLYESWQLRKLAAMNMLDAHPAFARGGEFAYMPERERKPGFFARWRSNRARRRAERAAEEEADLREKVDAILEKVSREGIGSLTPGERRILDEASRRRRGD